MDERGGAPGQDGDGMPPGGFDPLEGMGTIVWLVFAVALFLLTLVVGTCVHANGWVSR